jgi:transcriptional regulator with XRE-family HTH domain
VSRSYQGRREFGARLRRLRLEAGLTGKQLADRAGWAQSKVSRIETGQQSITTDDVRAWATASCSSPELLEDLLANLRSLRVEHAAWRRQLRGGHAPKQRALIALEGSATLDRTFQPDLIPGLLQTPDYARHVFTALATLRDTPNDVEAAVRFRVQRQAVLYDRTKQFRFLLAEAALRAQLGPPYVQRDQLDRLLVLTSLDTVELAVIPLEARLPVVMHHGFSIEDEDLVLVETFSAELQLRDADDVALYSKIFELLWGAAQDGDRAAQLVRTVARDSSV